MADKTGIQWTDMGRVPGARGGAGVRDVKGVPTMTPAEEAAWARGLSAAAEAGAQVTDVVSARAEPGISRDSSAAVPASRALTVPITRTRVGPAPRKRSAN